MTHTFTDEDFTGARQSTETAELHVVENLKTEPQKSSRLKNREENTEVNGYKFNRLWEIPTRLPCV